MSSFEPALLVGSQLTLVKGSEHQCSLVLELPDRVGGVEISIESSGNLRVGGKSEALDAGPNLACRCLEMLGFTVSGVEFADEGDLAIRFDSGDELVVRKEGPYESYQILLAGQVIYVG